MKIPHKGIVRPKYMAHINASNERSQLGRKPVGKPRILESSYSSIVVT